MDTTLSYPRIRYTTWWCRREKGREFGEPVGVTQNASTAEQWKRDGWKVEPKLIEEEF